MLEYLLVFVIAFFGSTIQTVVGFGFVIFLMALLPLFLPIGVCLVAAQLSGVFMSAVLVAGKTASLEPKKLLWPAVTASAASLLGLVFLSGIDNSLYMKLLGAVLVLLALWMMKFSSMVKIKPGAVSGGTVGVLGGLMGSLFGVSAPPLVLYYSAICGSKDSYVANLQLTLFFQTGVCILGRILFDMWPDGAFWYCIPALLGSYLGKFPGKWLYDKLDLKTFKMLVYIFMGILGIYIFLSNM